MMKKLIVPMLLVASLYSEGANAENIKLVCQNVDNNWLVGVGKTVRITLDMTNKTAAVPELLFKPTNGNQVSIKETETHLTWVYRVPWGEGSFEFRLDRPR
jgi:hypothetical protein